jgi:hypothetical protein
VKRLFCPVCAHEVYFDSLQCVRCRTELAMAVRPDGAIPARALLRRLAGEEHTADHRVGDVELIIRRSTRAIRC